MFESWKAKRAAAVAAKAEQEREQAEQQHQHEQAVYEWSIQRAQSIANGSFADVDGSVALRRGERAIYSVDDVGLVESRRGAGHWQGGTQGVSIRVPGTKSMRYRVGQTRGTYVTGDERPTVIDNGSVTITTTRTVFIGAKQNREWAWSKLIGFHDDDPSWIGIAVSNRQKMSGLTLPSADALAIVIALQAAAAAANGTAEQLIAELQSAHTPSAVDRGQDRSP